MLILLLKLVAWIAGGILLLFVSGYVAYKVRHKTFTKNQGIDIDLWHKNQ